MRARSLRRTDFSLVSHRGLRIWLRVPYFQVLALVMSVRGGPPVVAAIRSAPGGSQPSQAVGPTRKWTHMAALNYPPRTGMGGVATNSALARIPSTHYSAETPRSGRRPRCTHVLLPAPRTGLSYFMGVVWLFYGQR